MEERVQFVSDAASDRFTMRELCARYGVSRRVGYQWIARYDAEGRKGLAARSRAPHHCPHAISPRLAELLVTMRKAHPFWGARKLLAVLAAKHRGSRGGRRRARSPISSRDAAWCNTGGGGGLPRIRALSVRPRTRRTISGARTSRDNFGPGTASSASRSPSPIIRRACSWRVMASSQRRQ